MKALKRIVFKNLQLNKKRTFATILGIALGTTLICTVLFLFSSFYHIIIADNTSLFGYYHMHIGSLTKNDIRTLELNRDLKGVYPVSYVGITEIENNQKENVSYLILSMDELVSKQLGYQLVSGRYPKKEDEIIFFYRSIKDTSYNIGDTNTLDIDMSY